MSWTLRIVVILLLAFPTPGVAQSPVRDGDRRPAAPSRGSSSVGGIVVADESPARPLRRVTVQLISPDLSVPLSTQTNDAGRFTFEGVPAGTYGLSASKAGWVGAFYGSTRPGRGPGVPLAVRDGERVTDLVLPLTRGSVLTGTVRLPSGQAAQNMTVFVTGIEKTPDGPRLRLNGGRVRTDDRGQYRVYGLPAGDYVVQVQPSGFLSGAPTGINDAPQTTAAEVSWVQEIARIRAGEVTSVSSGPAHGRTMSYATVFFPGTADPANAAIVALGGGEERTGIDVEMVLVPTAEISGVVLGPDGLPLADARVSLLAAGEAPDIVALLSPRDAIRSAADGAFSLGAVPPGSYRISVRRARDAASAAAPSARSGVNAAVRTMASAGGGAADSGTGELWAEQDLFVNGEDVANLSLSVQPGMSVKGHVVFDGTSLDPPSADDLSQARVTLVPVQTGGSTAATMAAAAGGITGRIAADRTFAIDGIVPGRYRLSVVMPGLRTRPGSAGVGWTLRSALLRGTDIADTPLVINAGEPITGVTLTFSDHAAELIGSLTDAANRPAPGFPIVVFSVNRMDWTIGSRRVAVARPATDGTFRLFGLPEGRYYLAAAVDLVPADLDAPAFYEALLPGALVLTLTEGTRTVQNLRLAPD